MRRLATILAFLTLAGCGELQSTLAGGGPAAEQLGELSVLVYVIFSVVAVVMWGLIAWVALRRRGSLAEHAPADAGGGESWLVVGGFFVPLVLLSIVFIRGLTVMAAFPLHDAESHQAPDIRITGHQWWWEVDYLVGPLQQHFKTANEIHIPVDRPVTIELTSADVIHSFWVPRLHGKVDLIPGKTTAIRLEADAPAEYNGQCAEFCGAQHANMKLLVVAQTADDFDGWLASQREDAAEPSSLAAMRGEDVLQSGACALCHTVRGSGARGGVGPDLTHVASRRKLAANMLVMNTANLSAWITHAQSLKPEAKMPNLTTMNGRDLQNLVTYLQGLH